MLIEFLFGTIFFVLPLIGMFVTILRTEVMHTEAESVGEQTKERHVLQNLVCPDGTFKVREAFVDYVFKKQNENDLHGTWLLDTS
ncbi:hypothetical protein [Cellulosilyticum sp. I15G10I2]|uniref:hypothetical protein n=1 Tax=Cellulosilyticum sp. I15G10I2 TaxID=1892843 RepID=UPI00085BF24E|nr:hypothetical protein [Cellulosilyticum sp. I15G10I2]